MLISDGDKQVSYETSACRFLEWSDCSTAGCENYPGEKIKKKNYPGQEIKKTIKVILQITVKYNEKLTLCNVEYSRMKKT